MRKHRIKARLDARENASRGIARTSFEVERHSRSGKLTKENIERVCQLLSLGNSKAAAAESVGIAQTTMNGWQRAAQEIMLSLEEGLLLEEEITPRQELLLHFSEEMAKARARAEVWHVSNIRSHAEGDWKASAWWLERSRPSLFGKQSRVEHTGQGGGPIRVQPVPMEAALREMTDEELLQLQALEVRARRSLATEEGGSEEVPS